MHFRLYLVILSHNVEQKKVFLTLSELTKTLEDEQIYFLNKNKGTTNYAYSSKLKKTKLSKQRGKNKIKKKSNNKKEKKMQEIREYKIC